MFKGVYWKLFDAKINSFVKKFEKVCKIEFSPQDIEDVKKEFEALNEFEKTTCKIGVYTKCFSTYNRLETMTFFCWFPWEREQIETYLQCTA